MASGHLHAQHYPIGMVYVESRLVEQRLNREAVSNTLLLQMAVSSLFSKKGSDQFRKMVRDMIDE